MPGPRFEKPRARPSGPFGKESISLKVSVAPAGMKKDTSPSRGMIAMTPSWTIVDLSVTVKSPKTLIAALAIHASARPTPPVATATDVCVKQRDDAKDVE